jgi:hypothetical protein
MFITEKANTQKYIKNNFIPNLPKFQICRRHIYTVFTVLILHPQLELHPVIILQFGGGLKNSTP